MIRKYSNPSSTSRKLHNIKIIDLKKSYIRPAGLPHYIIYDKSQVGLIVLSTIKCDFSSAKSRQRVTVMGFVLSATVRLSTDVWPALAATMRFSASTQRRATSRRFTLSWLVLFCSLVEAAMWTTIITTPVK